ncbi:hypothetical protein [Bifidobacterium sp.]|uniref:hypothetical protein n=1 Tax=Bifidobacterium sp. TaxID=41200 RepID=UPI0039E8784F
MITIRPKSGLSGFWATDDWGALPCFGEAFALVLGDLEALPAAEPLDALEATLEDALDAVLCDVLADADTDFDAEVDWDMPLDSGVDVDEDEGELDLSLEEG